MSKPLSITPVEYLKPKLWYAGTVLGMDMYISVRNGEKKKFDLALKIIAKAFGETERSL
jgi:hypothetical protein